MTNSDIFGQINEVTTLINSVERFYMKYKLLPEEERKAIRHQIYKQKGRFGKKFFELINEMSDYEKRKEDSTTNKK